MIRFDSNNHQVGHQSDIQPVLTYENNIKPVLNQTF